MKSIINWYNNLQPWKRLTIVFLLNFIFWFSMQYLKHWFLVESYDNTLKKDLFTGIWMAIIWTLLFSWSLVKQTFKRKTNE